MTLRILLPLVAILAFVLFRSFNATAHLEKVEQTHSESGEADFPLEALSEPSATTLGEMYRISSRGSFTRAEAKQLAEQLASKKNASEKWASDFLNAYYTTARTTNAQETQ